MPTRVQRDLQRSRRRCASEQLATSAVPARREGWRFGAKLVRGAPLCVIQNVSPGAHLITAIISVNTKPRYMVSEREKALKRNLESPVCDPDLQYVGVECLLYSMSSFSDWVKSEGAKRFAQSRRATRKQRRTSTRPSIPSWNMGRQPARQRGGGECQLIVMFSREIGEAILALSFQLLVLFFCGAAILVSWFLIPCLRLKQIVNSP